MSIRIEESRKEGYIPFGKISSSGSGSTLHSYFIKKGSGIDGLRAYIRYLGVDLVERGQTIYLLVNDKSLIGRIIGANGKNIRELQDAVYNSKEMSGKYVKVKVADIVNKNALTIARDNFGFPQRDAIRYINGEYYYFDSEKLRLIDDPRKVKVASDEEFTQYITSGSLSIDLLSNFLGNPSKYEEIILAINYLLGNKTLGKEFKEKLEDLFRGINDPLVF